MLSFFSSDALLSSVEEHQSYSLFIYFLTWLVLAMEALPLALDTGRRPNGSEGSPS